MQQTKRMNGISVCNPVDMDDDYLRFTIDYAIEQGFNHYQFIGPIHDPVRGNIDGMIKLRKYARFNDEKDMPYVEQNLAIVNEVADKAKAHGIKTYMWHHELDLPYAFGEAFPEVLNSFGDIEVSHPLVKDFLENKIEDFFAEYPSMDGIILTLHETKVPLLKLKDQKLGKTERVKYVTKILFDVCNRLGKELIVRPFASVEEDYAMMTKAYREISTELIIMDKWTQFDWSLTLPNNAFFKKIDGNPLLVETDIFGEYFGRGRLPLMLKEHILEKVNYCEKFSPLGYVSRIDRGGDHPFGGVNEVNLIIMAALLSGKDLDGEINAFFAKKYGKGGELVREIMEETETIQKQILYLNGYYFHQGSFFPNLNHSKNHFYFEMMRPNHHLVSGEWFIPIGWERGSIESLKAEKQTAVQKSAALLEKLTAAKTDIPEAEYDDLYVKFLNLHLTAKLWKTLLDCFIAYVDYVEKDQTERTFTETIAELIALDKEGKVLLGEKYYAVAGGNKSEIHDAQLNSRVLDFVEDIVKSAKAERKARKKLGKKQPLDFIVCGGGAEGHSLKKEVNFSDTYLLKDGLCRIAGTNRGKNFSRVNAHGWFGYTLSVKPNTKNTLRIVMGSMDEKTEILVTIGGKEQLIKDTASTKEYLFTYEETEGKDSVYIRFDRTSANTPCVYSIVVDK